MSTVVIQIKQPATEPVEHVFELVGFNKQEAWEPMGIFHDVPAGTYEVKASFGKTKLTGSVTIDPAAEAPEGESAHHSDGMGRTVWL